MPGKQVTELDALPSFTDTSLLPVHNGAGLKKGLLSQLANYLGTKFSNPNLLINPDFKINQRGLNSYTSDGYTVDRWRVASSTLNATTKTLSSSNREGGTLLQYLEGSNAGTFTVTLNAISVTGTVYFSWKDGATYRRGATITKGINTYTFSASSLTCVGIEVATGASVQLSYMKLEQGAVATSFIAPNQAEEYLKCERFYQRVSLDLYPISLTNSQGFVPLNLETALRSTPTVSYWTNKIAVKKTYIDMTVEMLQFNKAWMSGSNVLAFQFATNNNRISLIINNGQGLGDIVLDAEIY